MLKSSNPATLLLIAQKIALSDGSISIEEKQMLNSLTQRFDISNSIDEANSEIDAEALADASLKTLAQRLEDHGERCLAARLACLVAGVSRNPGDSQDINSDERSAYRDLLDVLQLSAEELNEIEWSARQELSQGKPLLKLIGDAIFGEGAWPDASLMGKEMPGL